MLKLLHIGYETLSQGQLVYGCMEGHSLAAWKEITLGQWKKRLKKGSDQYPGSGKVAIIAIFAEI